MRNGLTIAASCLAFALGACSGVGSPPSAGPETGGPMTGDPMTGDGSGTEENDLATARKAVDDAREQILAIERLARAAQTDAQKAEVENRVAAARTQYLNAIQTLERAIAATEEGSAEREAARSYLRGINSIRAGDLARLDAALGQVGPERTIDGTFTTSLRPAGLSASSATITWTLREKPAAGVEVPDYYGDEPFSSRVVPADGFKPVLHESGHRLFGAGATSHELPLRGIVMRSALAISIDDRSTVADNEAGRFPGIQAGSQVGAPTSAQRDALDAWDNDNGSAIYHGVYHSAIQLPERGSSGGPTLKMGGRGAIFYDMEQRQRRVAAGCTYSATDANWLFCNDATTDDVTVEFNSPGQQVPDTVRLEWRTLIPFDVAGRNAGLVENDGSVTKGGGTDPRSVGRPFDQGEYRLYISRYAGVFKWLEPTSGDEPHTDDDEHMYLEYAAYGQFLFLDNATAIYQPSRMQAFHFGYDTFGGDNGKPIHVEEPITAKYIGWTSGYLAKDMRRFNALYPETVSGLFPLRGRVELSAIIGGEVNGRVVNGRIEGRISDIEYLRHGVWGTDIGVPVGVNRIEFRRGNVDNDGEFIGQTIPWGNEGPAYYDPSEFASDAPYSPSEFHRGHFGGNIYGPDAEEIAGAWYLPERGSNPHQASANRGVGYLFGSFGAKLRPDQE